MMEPMKPRGPQKPIAVPQTPGAGERDSPRRHRRPPQAPGPLRGSIPCLEGQAHWWRLEEATGTHAPAVCRHCGAASSMPVHFGPDVLPPGKWRIEAATKGSRSLDQ